MIETGTSGAVVECLGEPDAGLPDEQWHISGDFVFEDAEDRERQRIELAVAFEEIVGSAPSVTFNDELPEG